MLETMVSTSFGVTHPSGTRVVPVPVTVTVQFVKTGELYGSRILSSTWRIIPSLSPLLPSSRVMALLLLAELSSISSTFGRDATVCWFARKRSISSAAAGWAPASASTSISLLSGRGAFIGNLQSSLCAFASRTRVGVVGKGDLHPLVGRDAGTGHAVVHRRGDIPIGVQKAGHAARTLAGSVFAVNVGVGVVAGGNRHIGHIKAFRRGDSHLVITDRNLPLCGRKEDGVAADHLLDRGIGRGDRLVAVLHVADRLEVGRAQHECAGHHQGDEHQHDEADDERGTTLAAKCGHAVHGCSLRPDTLTRRTVVEKTWRL